MYFGKGLEQDISLKAFAVAQSRIVIERLYKIG